MSQGENTPNLKFKADAAGRDSLAPRRIADPQPGPAALPAHQTGGPELSKPPVWARERLKRLAGIFAAIERQVQKGSSVSAAIRTAARRWRNKTYKTAPGRKVMFSAETLDRLWYRYVRAGKNIAVCDLHYKAGAGGKKVGDDVALLLARLALDGDHASMASAIKAVSSEKFPNGTAPSQSAFYRRLPARTRKALIGLCRQRGKLKAAIRGARKVFKAVDR